MFKKNSKSTVSNRKRTSVNNKKTTAKKTTAKTPTVLSKSNIKKSTSPKPWKSSSPVWVLDIPFDPSIRLAASQAGSRWNPKIRASIYSGENLPESLKIFQPLPYSPSWHLQKQLYPDCITSQVSPSWKLRPHQIDGSHQIQNAYDANAPGFLLADDVGLGKTLTAWGFVLKQKWAQKILIVAPLSVLAHWRTTLFNIGDGDKEVWIVNYDSLGRLFEIPEEISKRAKGKRKRVAKKGEPPIFDMVIWDEAHKGKNPESARATMMRRISSKANFSLWLSATAGQEPLELSYLAPILAKRTKTSIPEPTLKAFGEWCQMQGLGVEKGQFGHWNKSLDPQVKEIAAQRLHSLLFEGVTPLALRRLPTDIAGWPELERQIRVIDLIGNSQQVLNNAWEQFKHEESKSPSPKFRQKQDISNALVRQLRLRQASSKARLESTVQITEEMLENGKQVAISVAFLDSLFEIQKLLADKKYKVSVIHGQQNTTEREVQRQKFQSGQSDVMLFTVEEGISLHEGEKSVTGYQNSKPRVLLIHDLRWSALQMAQIEGRCHRDGQFAPVLWLMAPNSIDTQIAEVLVDRVKTMKTLMGDDTQTMSAITEVLYKWAKK